MMTFLEAPRAVPRGRTCLAWSVVPLAVLSLIVGCGSDPARALARPVDGSPVRPSGSAEAVGEPPTSSSTSTVAEPQAGAEQSGVTSVAPIPAAHAGAATPATLPLMNATPSPLLTQVDAGYSDAYSALLAAAAIPDENHAPLTATMADGQREQWRSVIRRMREDGLFLRQMPGRGRWHRIESIEVLSPDSVRINVCRFDPDESVGADGVIVTTSEHPFRYLETIERVDGTWKWAGREWVDPSDQYSDCAWQ